MQISVGGWGKNKNQRRTFAQYTEKDVQTRQTVANCKRTECQAATTIVINSNIGNMSPRKRQQLQWTCARPRPHLIIKCRWAAIEWHSPPIQLWSQRAGMCQQKWNAVIKSGQVRDAGRPQSKRQSGGSSSGSGPVLTLSPGPARSSPGQLLPASPLSRHVVRLSYDPKHTNTYTPCGPWWWQLPLLMLILTVVAIWPGFFYFFREIFIVKSSREFSIFHIYFWKIKHNFIAFIVLH